ncbi:hypothetical protein [Dethiobacter alkaliphilus]|uniref:Uncharacterized protein n=1 Tax=Dethiobacter alkaliphilus AHT 1 TaxID=555088 RepID=C0GI19_DETAL|nr:hypothetical protein [Dethiobacter alkaliphilus]EEG77093.1 hypothetical protein DealDRAFT_2128 [Dethiobacter alkaliphilus AHT 1]
MLIKRVGFSIFILTFATAVYLSLFNKPPVYNFENMFPTIEDALEYGIEVENISYDNIGHVVDFRGLKIVIFEKPGKAVGISTIRQVSEGYRWVREVPHMGLGSGHLGFSHKGITIAGKILGVGLVQDDEIQKIIKEDSSGNEVIWSREVAGTNIYYLWDYDSDLKAKR